MFYKFKPLLKEFISKKLISQNYLVFRKYSIEGSSFISQENILSSISDTCFATISVGTYLYAIYDETNNTANLENLFYFTTNMYIPIGS